MQPDFTFRRLNVKCAFTFGNRPDRLTASGQVRRPWREGALSAPRLGSLPSSIPLPHHSDTPPPRIPMKISCNPGPRFPLYGVEAGSLPAKLAQRKEERARNAKNDLECA